MIPTVIQVKALPEFRLSVTFADGFTAQVNLKRHVLESDWPIVEPLKQPDYFRKVRVKNGSVAWPNGYDVCPEVLRFWCQGGHATTQAETDAHFKAEGKIAA